MEGDGKPPTSLDDSLVVFFGRGRGRRDVESHQRVVMTRWWWFWVRMRAEGDGKPPTSLNDSLVVVLVTAHVTACLWVSASLCFFMDR